MKITKKFFLVLWVGAMMADTLHAASPKAPDASAPPPIALSVSGRPTHSATTFAPTSQFTQTEALAMAVTLSRLNGRDIIISTVTPTGSMRPYFDENAVLLLEAVPFSELRVGDVVTFAHPKLQIDVAHRLVEKRGNLFWTKGDNNSGMDNIYVTPENFHRRLVGIIYLRPESATSPAPTMASGEQGKWPTQSAARKPGE